MPKETIVYIVTNDYPNINYRALKLLGLNKNFEMRLICKGSDRISLHDPNIVILKSYRNIINLFKKIRLYSVSIYLNKLFYFPSPVILFAKKVEKYLLNEVKKNINSNIVIITITPPHDLALVGLKIKKKIVRYVGLLIYKICGLMMNIILIDCRR